MHIIRKKPLLRPIEPAEEGQDHLAAMQMSANNKICIPFFRIFAENKRIRPVGQADPDCVSIRKIP